jgi:hypothetical protein
MSLQCQTNPRSSMAVVKTMLSSSGCQKWTPTLNSRQWALLYWIAKKSLRQFHSSIHPLVVLTTRKSKGMVSFSPMIHSRSGYNTTPDVANNARMKYENCKQREGTTVESYFLRHRRSRRQFGRQADCTLACFQVYSRVAP